MLLNETSEDAILMTSVVQFNFMNPLTDGDFEMISDANITGDVTLKLNEANTTDVYVSLTARTI